MQNKVLLTLLIVTSSTFTGGVPSKPKPSDYYVQAEQAMAAQEAAEREARIQAHAEHLAAQKAASDAAAHEQKLKQIKSIARGIAHGLKSAGKLVTGQTKDFKEGAVGALTITTIGTTSYYSYKHWNKIKMATNPQLWACIIIGATAIKYIFEK